MATHRYKKLLVVTKALTMSVDMIGLLVGLAVGGALESWPCGLAVPILAM